MITIINNNIGEKVDQARNETTVPVPVHVAMHATAKMKAKHNEEQKERRDAKKR